MNSNNTGHSGRARKSRATTEAIKRQRSVPVAPVTVTVHNVRVLATAQAIVQGYTRRGFATHVVGNPDGSVSVVNGR